MKTFCMVICFQLGMFSQQKMFITYDVLTKEVDSISFNVNSSYTSDYTNGNYGTESGFSQLTQIPPVFSTPDSNFTGLFKASDLFDINSIPIRTTVKIGYIENDTIKPRCTGTLVAPNVVLTAAHCVCWYSEDSLRTMIFTDKNILIYPSFNDGKPSDVFRHSGTIKYFVSGKFYYGGSVRDDIGLLILQEPIGIKTGWFGIAFNQDTNFYHQQLYHKFSYPAHYDLDDTTKVYNGDTLYYSYGRIGSVENYFLGYNIRGIPGQSGSALFNTNNSEYNIWGVQVFDRQSRHCKIDKDIFYSFKNILDEYATNIEDTEVSLTNKFYLANAYPNPFNPVTNIEFFIPKPGRVTLKIYDILGNEIALLVDGYKETGSYKITFNSDEYAGGNLSSGVLFCRLNYGSYYESRKLILLK